MLPTDQDRRVLRTHVILALLISATACDLKPVKYYTISVEAPEGGVISVATGSGIDCGEDCAQAFLPGTEVVLKAKALPGWFFRRWEGECSEQRATCRFIVHRDAKVFAVFRRDAQASELAIQIVSKDGATGGVVSNPEGLNCPGTCFALFPKERRVRLDAQPDALSQLDHWEGACTSTTTSCFVRLGTDKYVTAVFSPRSVTLTVQAPKDGRIVSSPPGIDCGDTCRANFVAGTVVQLTAVPDEAGQFQSWTSGCRGEEATCQVTLDQDLDVSAEFLGMRDLTVRFSGGGEATVLSTDNRVNCNQDCTVSYLQGSEVTLGAAAHFGTEVIGWESICNGPINCSFTVEDDMEIELAAALVDFDLSVNRVGAGDGRIVSVPAGIDCGATCSVGMPYRSRVSLTAAPELGSQFAGWAGACLGTAQVCLVTINDSLSVTAYFVPQFTLTATVQGLGRGVIRSDLPGIDCGATCEAFYGRDTTVTLTVEANRGSYFINWAGACSGSGDCVVTLEQSLNVDAYFGLLDFPFHVSVGGSGVGTVTSTAANLDCPGDMTLPWNDRQGLCQADFPFGSSFTLRASAAPGSKFVQWKGVDCPPTERCTVNIDGVHSVQAVFEPAYVLVLGGEYLRGSPPSESGREADEGPQLPIAINRGLWFKETEVSIGEWMRVMGSASNPGMATNCGANCPIQGISWSDAVAYLNALSRLEDLETCYSMNGGQWSFSGLGCAGYRLPSEAEWEWAARAGGSGPFSTGGLDNSGAVCMIESQLSLLGWYCGNTVSVRNTRGLNPNAFGLYDMYGNVAEWTNDVYDANYYISNLTNLSDPPGPVSTASAGEELRSVRGGAFSDYAKDCRSAKRGAVRSSTRSESIGFRPVRSNFQLFRPGEFTMGSPSTEAGHQSDESPLHQVVHTRPFLIERTEVTQAQYRAYPGNVSNPSPAFFSSCGANCPVEMVRFDEAIVYLNNLSAADGLVPCYVLNGASWVSQGCSGYRLPTEAEWERAARAGRGGALSDDSISASGCADTTADSLGWYCYNSANMTHAVADKEANAAGLFDVHGNVSEWVSDWFDSNYYGTLSGVTLDPKGPSTGSERSIRGGSWASPIEDIRLAARDKNTPLLNLLQVGMRAVKEYCPSPQSSVLNLVGAPTARTEMSVSRAGEYQVVFGGRSPQNVLLGSGAIYNTQSGRWSDLPLANAPPARQKHAATWTGKEVIVWGGSNLAESSALSNGARFAPATGLWSSMAAPPSALSGRFSHSMVWTGSELVMWGGHNGEYALGDGARYLPEEDQWLPMSASPLAARSQAASVWTGEEVFIFGGRNLTGSSINSYASYNPKTDRWSSSRANSAGCGGRSEAYLLSGHIIVISETGWCQYELSSGQWTPLPPRPGSRIMSGPSQVAAAVSGAELFVFGGSMMQASDGSLDAYSPMVGAWRSSPIFSPNAASLGARATWTGCGMWIWSSDGVSSNSYYVVP